MTLNISRTQHNHDPQPAPDVQDVQHALIRRGYNCGPHGEDGVWGSDTETAVIRFQRKLGLSVDGVVGPDTWGKLRLVAPTAATSATAFANRMLARLTGTDGHPRPRYDFGAEAHLTDPFPSKLDCSEAVEWAIYQAIKVDWRDGSWNQAAGSHLIPVKDAVKKKGALLFVSSNGHISGVHHVAVSLGNGKTAEARSSAYGCGSWSVYTGSGKLRFNLAGICPVLKY